MRTVRHADKHWETFAFLKQNSNANALLLFFKSQIVVYRISISSQFSSRLLLGAGLTWGVWTSGAGELLPNSWQAGKAWAP